MLSLKQQENTRRDEEQARLKETAERARLEAFSCPRCSAKYPSNIKLHEHIKNHHKRCISALSASSASSTSSASPAFSTSKLSFAPITCIETPSTPSLNTSLISSSKPPGAAYIAPLTTPPTPPLKASKPATYMTMNDLFRMFRGKPPPPEIREKPAPLPYKTDTFSPVSLRLWQHVKELRLAVQKICFRFAPDYCDRGKSLRYVLNSTRPPCNFSRLLHHPQQP